MPRFLLAALMLALGGFTALAEEKPESKDDPKSDNKGKLVGKWKMAEFPQKGFSAEELKRFEDGGLYFTVEFKQGGACEMGVGGKSDLVDVIKKSPETANMKWQYKLLAGEGIEFSGLPKQAKEGFWGKGKESAKMSVKIDGDKMTITDADGKTAKFVRIKEVSEK
jgi:hypothetical protein